MSNGLRKIELLAPAKNLECGIAAIYHGADAVYIGAAQFGARQTAGNSTDDIAELTRYAHQFGAAVYVTVNTIVYEKELAALEHLLKQLVEMGVDAILVQDMAVLEIYKKLKAEYMTRGYRMPALHASTQTDNRSADKVKWLKENGFERVVLARELSLEEITDIHKAHPDVELEAFVHGALCVSYSGACYASQYFFNRSANRGECAQFCRMAFDLKDSDGETLIEDSYLLSLKDMCQLDRLGDLLEAGVCSLKIEGRLKDANYVKNVVATYSEALNAYIAKHTGKYCRSSYGRCTYTFTPALEKTFNRGFTHYFFNGRQKDISSFNTPKAMGEYVGYVKEIRRGSFNVAGTAMFANGDGLCFFNRQKKLEGFRVNRVENNRLFPLTMPKNLEPGMALYRNNDIEFERAMQGKTATRKLQVRFVVDVVNGKLTFTATDECGRSANVVLKETPEKAQKSQHDNIVKQLEKLGNTVWTANEISINNSADEFFIPSSRLAAVRRELLEALEDTPVSNHTDKQAVGETATNSINANNTVYADTINIANVANTTAQNYYAAHGVKNAPTAFELNSDYKAGSTTAPSAVPPLMTCRYCLRYALGYCVKNGGKRPTWHEPLHLEAKNGIRVRLAFNCAKCQMEVYAE
ncbi:peptidase, U32 family [Leyella stercorea DSM 18206]|uniref:Peptidase, U32 family n=1 Tax=Leyella stercorea DSM 18206 TaxID=1002367 RepID=G6AXR7_9BACT|nr:U32 family peptidase [Leyella stercorea]EHJ40125.1 peptidase, U32 family [Leyella stercorea DSM 18206]